jgi:hypothetical protein
LDQKTALLDARCVWVDTGQRAGSRTFYRGGAGGYGGTGRHLPVSTTHGCAMVAVPLTQRCDRIWPPGWRFARRGLRSHHVACIKGSRTAYSALHARRASKLGTCSGQNYHRVASEVGRASGLAEETAFELTHVLCCVGTKAWGRRFVASFRTLRWTLV